MAETEKKKKALLIASMASMLDNFNRGNIDILLDIGYELTLASNFCTKQDSNSEEKTKYFLDEMKAKGVKCIQIDFSRHVFKFREQWQSYQQVKRLLRKNFDLIHCHSPICAAITRVCAKKYRIKGTKLIYTAHGFHFYKGSSFLSWVTFYPIEKWLSKYTDLLITINNEDYSLAKRKFKSKKTVYMPGVGIDTKLFREITTDRNEKRLEIGVKAEEILILSVGELSVRKNHMVILDAIIHLEDNVKYYIVGQGQLKEIIERRAKELGISNRVKLLGYRNDIRELLWAADIFAFPSLQEGLPVALMEAEAARIPLVASDIRGNNDIVRNGENGYLVKVNNSKEYECAFKNIINGKLKNLAKVKLKEEYDIKNINKIMREYYLTI